LPAFAVAPGHNADLVDEVDRYRSERRNADVTISSICPCGLGAFVTFGQFAFLQNEANFIALSEATLIASAKVLLPRPCPDASPLRRVWREAAAGCGHAVTGH
jgi:hypothetical protein